jgi:hypothetical protein
MGAGGQERLNVCALVDNHKRINPRALHQHYRKGPASNSDDWPRGAAGASGGAWRAWRSLASLAIDRLKGQSLLV